MTKDDALKLALECTYGYNQCQALALAQHFNPDWDAMAVMVEEQQRMAKRIEELEQALAQPAPVQPVAWLYPEGLEALKAGKCWTAYGTKQNDNCNISVYLNAAVAPKVEPAKAECGGFDSRPAAPVQEPVLWGVLSPNGKFSPYSHWSKEDAERIAAISHVGTVAAPLFAAPQQPAQEPVAWLGRHINTGRLEFAFDKPAPSVMRDFNMQPVYTTPPAAQRPWVGLTDEQYDEIWRMDLNNRELMDKTIAALKEKNT